MLWFSLKITRILNDRDPLIRLKEKQDLLQYSQSLNVPTDPKEHISAERRGIHIERYHHYRQTCEDIGRAVKHMVPAFYGNVTHIQDLKKLLSEAYLVKEFAIADLLWQGFKQTPRIKNFQKIQMLAWMIQEMHSQNKKGYMWRYFLQLLELDFDYCLDILESFPKISSITKAVLFELPQIRTQTPSPSKNKQMNPMEYQARITQAKDFLNNGQNENAYLVLARLYQETHPTQELLKLLTYSLLQMHHWGQALIVLFEFYCREPNSDIRIQALARMNEISKLIKDISYYPDWIQAEYKIIQKILDRYFGQAA